MKPTEELPGEIWHEDARPAFEELAPFTDGLPPKERAAVVLRYGYGLDYEELPPASIVLTRPAGSRP